MLNVAGGPRKLSSKATITGAGPLEVASEGIIALAGQSIGNLLLTGGT